MYTRPRIIPCLTMIDRDLVKTIQFKNPRYLGDPVNSVKIFNGKGVDELCILDIRASSHQKGPDFEYLKDIASESFMPLSYGGGITKISEIEKLFYIGYEKVILNSALVNQPELVVEAVAFAGSQSIVASIDVKVDLFGKRVCYINGGTKKTSFDPIALAIHAEKLGVGEIVVNSISRDGTMQGYDIDLIRDVSSAVKVPVIACGGARNIHDFKLALHEGGAHAVAASSMFVYYGNQKAVLITAPSEEELKAVKIYCDSEDKK